MLTAWVRGTLARRRAALALAGAGVAVASALVGVLLVFAAASGEDMTRRALAGLPVDWQVAVGPGGDVSRLSAELEGSPGVTAVRRVGYLSSPGFEAVTGGTTQTTGAGVVLGLPDDYAAAFPGQVRPLAGAASGVLLAQQTAANLHVGVGDTVAIGRAGLPPVAVAVDGIVDLPNAGALFQAIGPGRPATATATPDDVVLMPLDRWAALDGGAGARWQLHARLDHAGLPTTPGAAYADVLGRARHLELAAAGALEVGDNLAARLDAVRTDALFSGLMLLVLGSPGVALSLSLTVAVMRAQAVAQRRRAALLGLRGASTAATLGLLGGEGAMAGVGGALAGCAGATLLARFGLGADLGSSRVLAALGASLGAGLPFAAGAILLPTLAQLRGGTVATRRAALPEADRRTSRLDTWLGAAALAAGGLLFWQVAGTGYQVVLAPEGVAAASVDTGALLVPFLLWTGAWALARPALGALLGAAGPVLVAVLSPVAGRLALPVAASLVRRRRRVAGHAATAALAIAFATSVSVFAATYRGQALVDARLTNGADVTVTGSPGHPAGERLAAIRAEPGVAAAEPMQHRSAYVGHDLQDLYGIDAAAIGRATDVADAYFADGDAAASLRRLAGTADGVLLSQETVNDFQLALGDPVTLRLPVGPGRAYAPVPFRFVGVVSEFPTAPRDSFLVANAAYVAAATGDGRAEVVLVRADRDPARVAGAIRATLGPAAGMRVTDVAEAGRIIGSSLAAVDLRGLAAIEEAFAAFLVAGAAGLVLWLGLSERRAEWALMTALGATARQTLLAAAAEAAVVGLSAGVVGLVLGELVALVLVKLLGGAFDPPPAALLQPWPTLLAFLGVAAASLAAGCSGARPPGARG